MQSRDTMSSIFLISLFAPYFLLFPWIFRRTHLPADSLTTQNTKTPNLQQPFLF